MVKLPGIRRLRSFVRGREKRILPQGTIRFHANAQRGMEVDWSEVEETRNRFNISDFHAVHGTVMEHYRKAYAIMGPAGVGKSTLADKMRGEGFSTIDDGWFLAGQDRDSGDLKVVETGYYKLHSRVTRIQKSLRGLMGGKRIEYDTTNAGFKRRAGLDVIPSKLALVVSKLTARDESEQTFTPRALPLAGVVCLKHKEDFDPVLIKGNTAEAHTTSGFLSTATPNTRVHVIQLPDKQAIAKAEETLRMWVGKTP